MEIRLQHIVQQVTTSVIVFKFGEMRGMTICQIRFIIIYPNQTVLIVNANKIRLINLLNCT